jgi:hypothetical protein
MNRIILEDMKLNKDRRSTSLKKETASSPMLDIERKAEDKEEYKKKDIKEKSKIDEYYKNRKNNERRFSRTPESRTKRKIIHKPILFIFIICLIFSGIYWGGNFFQKADIDITVKHQLITYRNKQFIASKKESGDNINFEIMITPNKKSVDVVLTEPKEVSIKAKGSIILYNEFSTKKESISAGTFLSDNEGKTYKTNNTISIPGYKTVNKKIVPGQVSVNITSFLPGDAYNGSPSDFYINSFKGTTKYKKIYGKLKSPLVGGASGIVYTLDDKSKKSIDNIATTSFKEDLLTQVKTLVPSGYIIYPGAFTFSYNGGEDILSKTPETSVEINGTLSVILLKEESLIDNIIKISLPDIKDDELKEITISDLNKLSFSFINKDQIITKDIDSVSFSLSGDIDAVWNPNTDILKTKLIGIHKDDVLSIFGQDPGISQALVKIFPPWQKYLPNDLLKININMQ